MTASEHEVFALRAVSLRRDGRAILTDVTWTIRDGERRAVLGPNGAGKTTLVRILSTYLVASSGVSSVLGRRLGRTDVRELRTQVGYLSPALAREVPEELTPRQIVDAAQAGALFPWYVDPGRMNRGRTDAALKQVGLSEAYDRPYATYSSGEQLRIQLARALVSEPKALLMDEPMASLDIGGREGLISTLSHLAAGTIDAIVLVLHRVEDIPPGFTHALLMRDGRIMVAGTVADIITDEALSACFGLPLRVGRRSGRLSAVAG
ncbi:MAG: ABC transporter ATP-binding protein [Candidatus Limnocylindria bacterium]